MDSPQREEGDIDRGRYRRAVRPIETQLLSNVEREFKKDYAPLTISSPSPEGKAAKGMVPPLNRGEAPYQSLFPHSKEIVV